MYGMGCRGAGAALTRSPSCALTCAMCALLGCPFGDVHCAKTGGGPRNSCSICRRAVLDANPLDRGALRAAHRVAFSKPQLV